MRLVSVQGRDGQPVSKDADRDQQHPQGFAENRGEEATAILWTLWGKQAENAAQYLGKVQSRQRGRRVQNNNYDKDGETVSRHGLHRQDRLPRHQGRRRRLAREAIPGGGGGRRFTAGPQSREGEGSQARQGQAELQTAAMADADDDIAF